MLKTLSINNIVIIKQVQIEFEFGLVVLTGETGSGKSILLDALGLAIGFRSNLRLIGNHNNKAEVSAEFNIKENLNCQKILEENSLFDNQDPDILRIRRIIADNSANKVLVNDHIIGVNLLAKIGETLVEIHGQHDQHGLLNSQTHLTILDEFSNNSQLLTTLSEKYQKIKELDQQITQFKNQKEKIEQEYDYLSHVINELTSANIKTNEEQELLKNREQILAQEKILNFLNELKDNLTEAINYLMQGQKNLIRNQNLIENYLQDENENFNQFNHQCENHLNQIDNFVKFSNQLIKNINNQNFDRDEIEERLFLIRNLARKHNINSNQLINLIEETKTKLSLIDNSQKNSLDLENQRSKLFEQYLLIAHELSARRKKFAKILSSKVEEELKFLKMNDTKFNIEFIDQNSTKLTQEIFSINGIDRIRFTASTNKNGFDDIGKIASGGELSRFMLALKVALINVKSTPTMIFDEIDTGISGSTAEAVGKRLKVLAKNLQILLVTHQPQIASKADSHFKISKDQDISIENNSKIQTKISRLSLEQSEEEIARMLSGEEITKEAILVAKKLMTLE